MRFFNITTSSGLGEHLDILNETEQGYGQAAVSVKANPINGNLFVKDHTTKIVSQAGPIDIGMVYNSQSATPWQLNQGKQLNLINQKELRVKAGDGSELVYRYDASRECYVSQGEQEGNSSIQMQGADWVCTYPQTGIKEYYKSQNQLEKSVNPDGSWIQYIYQKDGKLEAIHTSSGQNIKIKYKDKQIQIFSEEAEEKTLLASYQFDKNNRLIKTTVPVSDIEDYQLNYRYHGDSQLLQSISQADNTSMSFDYKGQKIEKLVDGEGRFYQLSYEADKTLLKDPCHKISTFGKTADNKLSYSLDASKEREQYYYDEKGKVIKIIYADGTKKQFAYDALGFCSKIIDRNDHKTTFKHHPQTGVLLNKTRYVKGQEQTTCYVYNNKRQLSYEISPEGGVIKYQYDKAGNRINKREYLKDVYDKASEFNHDAAIELDQMQAWEKKLEYPQKCTLTDYKYNQRGQCIKETRYARIAENGVGIRDELTGIISNKWDIHGHCVQHARQLDKESVANEEAKYDGLSRKTWHKNELDEITLSTYKAEKIVAQSRATGISTISTSDKAGNLTGSLQCAGTKLRENIITRDVAGRPCMFTLPGGQKEYTSYDDLGRKQFHVDAGGYLTEYRYDQNGNQTHLIEYQNFKNEVNEDDLKAGNWQAYPGQIRRVVSDLYDAENRLRFHIDGENFVIENIYDEAGNKIEEIAYADRMLSDDIDDRKMLNGKLPLLQTSIDDRQHRYFFNKNNQLIAEQLASGHVIAYALDKKGQIKKKTHYAAPQKFMATWNPRQIDESPHDAVDTYERDACGRIIKHYDAEGYLTVYIRDAAGRIKCSMRGEGDEVLVKKFSYDAKDRVIEEQHNNGKHISTRYHASGQIESEHQYEDDEENKNKINNKNKNDNNSRFKLNVYDEFMELESELSDKQPIILNQKQIKISKESLDSLSTVLARLPLSKETNIQHQDIWTQIRSDFMENSKDSEYADDIIGLIRKQGDIKDQSLSCIKLYCQVLKEIIKNKYWKTWPGGSLILDVRHGEGLLPDLSINIVSDTLSKIFHLLEDKLKHQDAPEAEWRALLVEISGLFEAGINKKSTWRGKETQHFYEEMIGMFSMSGAHKIRKIALEQDAQSTDAHCDIRYVRGIDGLKIASIDAMGNKSYYFYDKLKRPLITILPTGAVLENTYVDSGDKPGYIKQYFKKLDQDDFTGLEGGYINNNIKELLSTIADPVRDVEQEFKHDRRGLLQSKIDGEKYKQTEEYNAFHELSAQSKIVDKAKDGKPARIVKDKFGHDKLGRPTSTIHDVGGIEAESSVEYQDVNGLEIHQDANGNKEEFHHDRLNRDTKHVDAEEKASSTAWDAQSRIKSHTNALNQKTTKTYEQGGKKITTETPDGTSVNETNIFGQQVSEEQQNGNNSVIVSKEYDHRGLISSITDARGKTVFKRNKAGWITDITNPENVVTHFEHDALGQVLFEIQDDKGLQLKTEYLRDGMGRVIAKCDPNGVWTAFEHDRRGLIYTAVIDPFGLGLQTLTEYDGLHQATSKIQGDMETPDQYKLTFENDNSGHCTSSHTDPDGLDLVNKTERDKVGNITKLVDGEGRETHIVYDAKSRERFRVSPEGVVTQKDYDTIGNCVSEVVHGKKIVIENVENSQDIMSIQALTDNQTADDLRTNYYFDGTPHPRFSINFLHVPDLPLQGVVTEHVYDKLGNEILRRNYSNLLNARSHLNLTTQKLVTQIAEMADPENDRQTYFWFEKSHLERFALDHNGYLVEKRYDKMGRKIEEISYAISQAELVNGLDLAPAELDANIQKDPVHDRCTRFYYDKLGREIYNVSAEGVVTKKEYDNNNKCTKIVCFKNRIDNTLSYAGMRLQLNALIPQEKFDNITTQVFDSNNQLKYRTNALGFTEEFERDSLGSIRRHIDNNKHVWKLNFDRAKRLVEEITPLVDLVTTQLGEDGKLHAKPERAEVITKTAYDKANQTQYITHGFGRKEARTIHFSTNSAGKATQTRQTARIDCSELSADLIKLPAKNNEVITKIAYNANQQVIAECNEIGNWSYKTYDSLGRLCYEVDKAGAVIKYEYNQFDELIKETRFAVFLPSGLDINSFGDKGLPAYEIEKYLNPKDEKNRVISFKYEDGEIEITQNEVYYYDGEDNYGKASPVTKRRYNAFGNCVYESRLISPGKWEEKHKWYDRDGHLIAELDPERYLTVYERTASGKEERRHEYAMRIKDAKFKHLTFEQLKLHMATDVKDRHYYFKYDAAEQCIEELIEHATVYELSFNEDNKPFLIEKIVSELKTCYGYDGNGNQTSVTYADGSKVSKYYNECSQQIAEIGELRELKKDGQTILVSPLTTFGRNAFGEVEKICRHKEPLKDPSQLKIPENHHNEDQVDLALHDNRGLVQAAQDAEENIKHMTHTKTKKPARILQEKTELKNITENGTHQIVAEKHLDEEKLTYNKLDKRISSVLTRDQINDISSPHYQETHFRHNAFGEVEGVGEDGSIFPAYTDHDATGAVSVTNTGDGVPTVSLRDLRGHETLSLQTPENKIDLRLLAATPDSLLSMEPGVVERSEIKRDKRGLAVAYFAAFWYLVNHNKLPTKQFAHDRWKNCIKKIDSKGNETDIEFNHLNQEIKTTLPFVDAPDSAGNIVKARPVNVSAHNLMGKLIGVIDGNGHVTGYSLNKAGQQVATRLADGSVEESQELDIFGNTVAIVDASDKRWEYAHDRLNHTRQMKKPSGRTISYKHDEAGNRNSESNDALNAVMIQNHDSRNNIFERYLPGGQLTHIHSDRNGMPLHIVENDKEHQDWKRDFFGHEEKYTDLSGQEEHSEYDAKFQLRSKRSSNAVHGPMVRMHRDIQYYSNDKGFQFPMAHNYFYVEPAPKKAVYYSWKCGLRYAIRDFALHKLSLYKFTSGGEPEELIVKLLPPDITMRKGTNGGGTPMPVPEDGVMIKMITTHRDALGRIAFVSDKHMNAANCYSVLTQRNTYDLADYVYSETLTLDAAGYSEGCRNKLQSITNFHRHNSAGRIDIANGEKSKNGVDIVSNKGLRMGYENGKRVLEVFVSDGVAYGARLKYTDDGELSHTEIDKRFFAYRTFNQGGQLSKYEETYFTCEKDDDHHDYTSKNSAVRIPIFDINGWQTSETFTFERKLQKTRIDPRKKVVTDFTNHPSYGFPITQAIRTDQKDNSNHDYTIRDKFEMRAMTGFGSWRPVSIFGERYIKKESGNGIGIEYFDPNGVINAKFNSADEQYDLHKIPEDMRRKLPFYFDTTPEGWVISKTHTEELEGYSNNERIIPREVETHHFGHDIEGHLFAGYWDQPHNNYQAEDAKHHLREGGRHTCPRISAISAPSFIRHVAPIKPLPRDGKCRPLRWNDPLAPILSSSLYITQPGDTFESIAQHDLRYARQIERENALMQSILKTGQMLHLPEYIPQSFKAHYSRPYQELLGVMMGSIMPFIKMPDPKKPKMDYVKIIIEVVAAAVIIYLSGGAGSAFAASLVSNSIISAGVAEAAVAVLATGVIAGASDSAIQFTNMKLGIRDNYSFKQSASIAIASATQAGAARAVGAAGVTGITADIMEVSTAAVASQLAEMEVGIRTRFDAGAVAQQIAAAVLAKKINTLADTHLGNAGRPTAASAAVSQTVQTATNSLLGSAIYHTPVDIKLMAAQSIGSSLSHSVTDKLSSQTPEGIPTRGQDREGSPDKARSAYPGRGAASTSRPLSAQDRKFIAETEAVAHMKLDEPGLDLNDRELTDFRRQTTASREARIHDTTDHVMGFLSDVTRGTLAGGVIDSVRNVRQDAYSVTYGTRDQRNAALLNLGVDVAVPVVFGVAGRAAEAIAPAVSKLGMWGRGGAERLAINASSPSEIAWGYGKLSNRQDKILNNLPDTGDFIQMHKSHVNPADLAALTAHTGDEFALFTLGSRRMVVRGTAKGLEMRGAFADKLLSQEWRWSAHTHPGLSDNVLMASGYPGDRAALQAFNQERSLILNSAGRRSIFDLQNDYAITNQSYHSIPRPGY